MIREWLIILDSQPKFPPNGPTQIRIAKWQQWVSDKVSRFTVLDSLNPIWFWSDPLSASEKHDQKSLSKMCCVRLLYVFISSLFYFYGAERKIWNEWLTMINENENNLIEEKGWDELLYRRVRGYKIMNRKLFLSLRIHSQKTDTDDRYWPSSLKVSQTHSVSVTHTGIEDFVSDIISKT